MNIRNTKRQISGTNTYKEHSLSNEKERNAKDIDIVFSPRPLFDPYKHFMGQLHPHQNFMTPRHARHPPILSTPPTHSTHVTHPFYPRYPPILPMPPTLFSMSSSNESIHITKREINDKSIGYFKTILSVVDWKHVLNENSPNNAYNDLLKIFWSPYTAEQRQKLNETVLIVLE